MRVLIVPYPGTWGIEGGHKTQELQTAIALRRAGCDVVIGEISSAFASEFDVVHYFGDPSPLLARGRPPCSRLVVTPIYFPQRIADGRFPRGPGLRAMWSARARQVSASVRHPLTTLEYKRELARRFGDFAVADVLVVNSCAEWELLMKDWSGAEQPPEVSVAYSGVDPIFFEGDPAVGRAILGLDDFVLSVGRIEPIKNQLTLCLAMQKLGTTLVLVGAILPGNEAYAAACRSAFPDVVHVPHIPHEQLPHVFAAARVHVLLSWFETTGLVTLEALASGTPVVASDTSCVREYFSDGARLVRPHRVADIQSSVRSALQGPTGLERAVAARYTWDRTARELLDAYRVGVLFNSGRGT